MHESWCTLPACYQPALLPPLLPLPCHIMDPLPLGGQNPPLSTKPGGTRGMGWWHQGTVLSVSHWNPPPSAPWISPAIVLGFPSAALRWAAVRVTQWPADLREKTDVPINFCQNVITSGLENHMGAGRERNRCITFKYAIIILQKFK